MKHLVLFLILVCSIIGLNSTEVIDGSPIRFSLLESQEYEIHLTTGTGIGRLFVGLRYSVNKSELQNTDYYSFFLNRNAFLEKVQINGLETRYNITTNLHPKHFVPELPQPELLEGNIPVNCYSFDASLFETLPEKITISLEYWLPLPAYQKNDDGREMIRLGSIPFLFARNLSQSSEINIQLVTTFTHAMDSAISTTDIGNVRHIRSQIIDIPKEDLTIDLYKLN